MTSMPRSAEKKRTVCSPKINEATTYHLPKERKFVQENESLSDMRKIVQRHYREARYLNFYLMPLIILITPHKKIIVIEILRKTLILIFTKTFSPIHAPIKTPGTT